MTEAPKSTEHTYYDCDKLENNAAAGIRNKHEHQQHAGQQLHRNTALKVQYLFQ